MINKKEVIVVKTDIDMINEEVVHELILNHLEDYSKYMEEVLALEMFTGLNRASALKVVAKNYPQFNIS